MTQDFRENISFPKSFWNMCTARANARGSLKKYAALEKIELYFWWFSRKIS